MSSFIAECRKFQPNIFNKNKCSNCFRQRDEHSTAALESNRACRKVSKCGYLFVSPDWDFSIPLNRTKRWQRRWFVLYDDGELTYSVDDLPATIPQGVINMTRVLEVTDAEEITGNQFALAITCPDRATFIKGTCREESRWWLGVLSVFPKQHGRHKRNATFPGIKSSSVLKQTRSVLVPTPTPSLAPSFDSSLQRSRFDSLIVGRPSSAPTLGGRDDVFPSPTQTPMFHSTPARSIRDEHKENTPPYIQDYDDHPPTSESPPTQDKVLLSHKTRTRRTTKKGHPRIDPLIITELQDPKREEKLKDIADSITRTRGSKAFLSKEIKPTRESDIINKSADGIEDVPDCSLSENIRGDPDGCGLESEHHSFPPVSDVQRVDLPAEEVLYIKKGWLLKQGLTKEWSKHWFVLLGMGLRFYRDPSAEDNGILDGIIDLGLINNIQERDVGRNYGFTITCEDKKYVFSAVTSGIRSSWVQAIRNAANLKEPMERPLTFGDKTGREIFNNESMDSSYRNCSVGRSFVSSDEDFKSASDASFFKDDSEDLTNYDFSTTRSRCSPPSSRRGARNDILQINDKPEKDYNSGESMLVDLLETQVESLKAKLEQTQLENDKSTMELQCQTIASLSADASNLRRRLGIYESDLDRSERETDRLRHDKKDLMEQSDIFRGRIVDLQKQLDGLQRTAGDHRREIDDKNYLISKLELLKKQFQKEKLEWQQRLAIEQKRETSLAHQGDLVHRLTRSLKEAEAKLNIESSKTTKDDRSEKILQENLLLKVQVSGLSAEISKLRENIKSEKSEVYKWKDLVKELRSLLDDRSSNTETDLDILQEKLKATQTELDKTADRLYRGIEENESLCNRIREFQRTEKMRRDSSSLSISSIRFSSRKSLPRLDSLSDLTNIDFTLDPEELDRDRLIDEFTDVRLRFEKAVNEIKALKREIKEVQSQQDGLELFNRRLKDESKINEDENSSQINLMSSRIQDLATKLTNSEKQLRTFKQKMSKAESRERRRTQSLKGRESFSLSKDMEVKLSQLESKVDSLLHEGNSPLQELKEDDLLKPAKRSKSFEESTKSSRLRRKSLDSQSDAMKAIVRVNDIESKVCLLSGEELRKFMEASTKNNIVNLSSSNNSLSTSRPKSPLRSPGSPRKVTRTLRQSSDKVSKLSRSESEPKILREKLHALEKVLNTLQTKLNECATLSGVMECTCMCSSSVLSRLQQNLSAASRVAQCRHISQVTLNRMEPLTSKLHQLLKDKMTQLVERRQNLRAKGMWTRDAQLKSLAERLAFETLILSQLAQMQQASQSVNSFESSLKLQELIEAHRKLSFLEKKLTDSDFAMEPLTPFEFYTSLLAEKLVVESDVITSISPKTKFEMNDTCKDLHNKVLERERSLSHLVSKYKQEKLHDMAVVMARETVAGTLSPNNELPEEIRLRQAWTIAQEMVAQELVNLETSQSLLRLTHVLGSESNTSFVAQLSAFSLDRLHQVAEESLRNEMEESAFTLSRQYEDVLARYRAGDITIINSVSASIEDVLTEFARVISQKALVDGQLALATGQDNSAFESLTEAASDVDPMDNSIDVVASEAHLLMFLGGGDPDMENKVSVSMDQAEFSFIFNRASALCISQVESVVASIKDSKGSDRERDSSRTPPSPKTRRRSETSRKSRRVSDITGMIDGCKQCDELRQELSRVKRSLEAKKVQKQEEECRECRDHIEIIKHLEDDHRVSIENLHRNHETERLKDRVKYDLPTRDSDDELTELKRRLCLLEEGYEAQISALEKRYRDSDEESVRQRYQNEIEHLREMCENGLNSMESSHRRRFEEIEEKHRKEMSVLRAEKEEALAEETRATLSALDAMRKAHEAEVQKEVSKFKEDFLRRSSHNNGGSHLEEVREVRGEILTLSEKYSGKCLEVATKEQCMDKLRKQLAEAEQRTKHLEDRNQQLKTRLASQASILTNEEPKSAIQWKKLHHNQMSMKEEEISRLNQLLEKSKLHESDLGALCGQLNQFICDKNILGEPIHRKDEGRRSLRQGKTESDSIFLSTSLRKEISRSPSCPRLSSMLWRNDMQSPLIGMVALRKKLFEGHTTKTEC